MSETVMVEDDIKTESYRVSIEKCKDRMVENFKIMRQEYPHLFKKDCSGLIHSEVVSDGTDSNA